MSGPSAGFKAPSDRSKSSIERSITRAKCLSSTNQRVVSELAFTCDTIDVSMYEQAGLPPQIEAECDTLCLIPMRGGADSLNLAQATAIMLYEGWRQRGFA